VEVLASGFPDSLSAIRALTINQHNAGLAGLQQLSIDPDDAVVLHDELSAAGIASVVLRTCNRTELYWRSRSTNDDETAVAALADCVETTSAVNPGNPLAASSRYRGEAAVRHLFRVCAGLESLVVGEAEILGQVREAMDACEGAGSFLQGVFRAAIRTGRQARAETAIGEGALSVASAGIRWLAEQLPLAHSTVVVIGAGDTARKAARHLRSLGVGTLIIANRTLTHAETLARTVGARATDLERLPGELFRANAIVCAAAAQDWLVPVTVLKAVAESRPIAAVDLAMPSAIEPGDVPGVTRIDLQGLQGITELHRQQRESEIPHVEAIIERELRWLHTWAQREALRPHRRHSSQSTTSNLELKDGSAL